MQCSGAFCSVKSRTSPRLMAKSLSINLALQPSPTKANERWSRRIHFATDYFFKINTQSMRPHIVIRNFMYGVSCWVCKKFIIFVFFIIRDPEQLCFKVIPFGVKDSFLQVYIISYTISYEWREWICLTCNPTIQKRFIFCFQLETGVWAVCYDYYFSFLWPSL